MDINQSQKVPGGEKILRANRETSIGRLHVETEESLASVIEFPKSPLDIKNFLGKESGVTQYLSGDLQTGEATERMTIKKGWKAPIGHFSENVELFVLKGHLKQGGMELRDLSYSFIPKGIAVGPWEAEEETVLLWMPDGKLDYDASPYAALEQIAENAMYHKNTQLNDKMTEYIPVKEINSMPWEQTTFLPPGSARKSLYDNRGTGRSTWILGLVPMWIEGNFLASHPTAEEAYMIRGDVKGHFCMQDAPFERRYTEMGNDGYYWRPAHVPHGPFWTETGALMLFRTHDKLDCHWMLHSTNIEQK